MGAPMYQQYISEYRKEILNIVLCSLVFFLLLSYYWDLQQENSLLAMRNEDLSLRVSKMEQFNDHYILKNTTNTAVLAEMEQIRSRFHFIEKEMGDMEMRVRDVAENAHKDISDEVQNVKRDMDIYVRVTNNQLSAESNFVRFDPTYTCLLTSSSRSNPYFHRQVSNCWNVHAVGLSYLRLLYHRPSPQHEQARGST